MEQEKNLCDRIDSVFDKLTDAQKQTAIFLKKKWEYACLMSAKKLSEQSGVSEATVHRLAVSLGYDSYIDMKEHIKEELIQNRALVNMEMRKQNNSSSWLEDYIQIEKNNLIATYQLNSKETISRSGDYLKSAKRIFVLGDKQGLGISSYLSFVLNYMLGNTCHLTLANIEEQIGFMSPQDVLIVIGFQRYCHKTEKVVKLAMHKGTKIIAFTDCDLSPFAQVADISILGVTDSTYFLDSYTAVFSVAQALIAKIVMDDGGKIRRNIEKTEEIYKECRREIG